MKKAIALVTLLFLILGVVTSCGAVSFPIHFIVDGEIYGTISTTGNEKLPLPKNPEKTGYIFAGWYWDEGVWERPFTANSLLNEPISSEMRVYAKWKEENAEEEYVYPTIVVSSAEVKAGDKGVEITVALKKNPGVTSMLMKVLFDNSAFELVSMSYNSELGGVTIPNASSESPVVAYWADNFRDVTADIVFVTLVFNVNENVLSGGYNVTVSYKPDDVFNVDEENVNFQIKNGKITVS